MNTDQKSTKNEAKNLPKMDENHAKTAPRAALVGSWPSRGPNTPPRRPKTFPRRPFGGVLGAWRPSWAGRDAQDGPKLAPKTEAKSVWGRPGNVLGASWRRHVADFMHFWCIFDACLKKYAFEAEFLWILTEKMFHGNNKNSKIILRKSYFLLSGYFNIRWLTDAI